MRSVVRDEERVNANEGGGDETVRGEATRRGKVRCAFVPEGKGITLNSKEISLQERLIYKTQQTEMLPRLHICERRLGPGVDRRSQ